MLWDDLLVADEETHPHSVTELHAAELRKHHQRLNEMRGIQIEICGRDGKGGIVASHSKDLAECEEWRRDMGKEMGEIKVSMGRMAVMSAAVAAVASAVLAAVVQLLIG